MFKNTEIHIYVKPLSTCRASFCCPFQRLRIESIVSMAQRRPRTAPKIRFGALLEPLGLIYRRSVSHLGPQERPKIGLRGSQMPSWGRLGSVLVPLGAFWGVLGAVLCPCGSTAFYAPDGPNIVPKLLQINQSIPQLGSEFVTRSCRTLAKQLSKICRITPQTICLSVCVCGVPFPTPQHID